MDANLEIEGKYQLCQTAHKKQGHQDELGGCLACVYECGAAMQMHCTTAFLGNCWHCNKGKPEPHVNDHGTHGCRLLLSEKTPHHRMDIDICSKRESQGHQEVESDSWMAVITGERDLSGNTNSAIARLLSLDKGVGIFSVGFSSVDVCDVEGFWTGMSSTEVVEAVSESI